MIDFKTISQRYQRYYTYLEPVVADPLIRGYFSLVASILLVAFFLVFALSPTVNTILSLQKKITDQNATIIALDKKIANLILAHENYSQVENLIPVLEAALPNQPTPQTAISQIMLTATPSGITVSGMQFQNVTLLGNLTAPVPAESSDAPPGLSVLPFSLSTNGPEDSLRLYLQKLENTLRYIRFQKLSFVSSADSAKITVDANGLTYYYVR